MSLTPAQEEIARLTHELAEAAQNAADDLLAFEHAQEVVRKLEESLAEALRERDEALAKCAVIKTQIHHHDDCSRLTCVDGCWHKDNPGQPFLDRLHRVEALIPVWREGIHVDASNNETAANFGRRRCADELEQALAKEEPHA